MTELWQHSARELADKVRTREVSALEVADAHISRVLRWNDAIEAFLHFEPEEIRRRARSIDRRVEAGQDPGRLAGVPVAVKDNICTKGMPTTCGSRLLEPFVPPYDAHAVQRLEEEGAVLFGKTNLDEFGMGSSTEHSAFGPTRNPYALDRTAGGSSGGSAAAVAAGLVPLALGSDTSDTGGSIRQPAAFCGIVGLKPTYGLVSRHGLVAFASSLDQIGPFARTVDDCALALEVIAGHDARDATSSVRGLSEPAANRPSSLRGLKVGFPTECFGGGVAEEIRAAVGAAQTELVSHGAVVEEVSLPLTRHAIAVYYLVAPCEASSNLARYDGVRYGARGERNESVQAMYASSRGEGFGSEVRRRILLGTFALSSGYYEAYYEKAQKVRAALRADLDEAFGRVDVLLTPTTPTVAFKLGERIEDPVKMYTGDRLTVIANLCGIPALSLPCGRTSERLPIGLQLMAGRFKEETLLKVARVYEAKADAGFEWPEDPAA
ncbi:MAG: Asp-tRNA(Asn)/Glu-tRNA(Gln) amidotransferase subunit GatA [Planctomycetota bacterium]